MRRISTHFTIALCSLIFKVNDAIRQQMYERQTIPEQLFHYTSFCYTFGCDWSSSSSLPARPARPVICEKYSQRKTFWRHVFDVPLEEIARVGKSDIRCDWSLVGPPPPLFVRGKFNAWHPNLAPIYQATLQLLRLALMDGIFEDFRSIEEIFFFDPEELVWTMNPNSTNTHTVLVIKE
jgi:hypothetical protein